MLQIKPFFYKYKTYIGYFLALFLLILLLLSRNGQVYIERVEESIIRNIQTVNSTDLFTESRPYILKEGSDGLREVLYRIDEEGRNIGIHSSTILESPEEEIQVRGTTLYSERRIEIENQVSSYLQDIVNKRYQNLNEYYPLFARTQGTNTWEAVKILNGNFIIEESIPLYNHYSSKALVQTRARGQVEDKLRKETREYIDIFSIYDSETRTFKILNPEYIPISRNTRNDRTTQLIERTQFSPTHNLSFELQQTLVEFPNTILFRIDSKSSENVTYNRVRVVVEKKESGEVIYDQTLNYRDFDRTVLWNRTLFNSRLGYGVNYYLEVQFWRDEFNTLFENSISWNRLDFEQYKVTFTPINDNVVNLVYPSFSFEY